MTLYPGSEEPLDNPNAAIGAGSVAIKSGDTHDHHSVTAPESQAAQQDIDPSSSAVLETAEAYLKVNPWKSSGAAASAGVLVGLLLARR